MDSSITGLEGRGQWQFSSGPAVGMFTRPARPASPARPLAAPPARQNETLYPHHPPPHLAARPLPDSTARWPSRSRGTKRSSISARTTAATGPRTAGPARRPPAAPRRPRARAPSAPDPHRAPVAAPPRTADEHLHQAGIVSDGDQGGAVATGLPGQQADPLLAT